MIVYKDFSLLQLTVSRSLKVCFLVCFWRNTATASKRFQWLPCCYSAGQFICDGGDVGRNPRLSLPPSSPQKSPPHPFSSFMHWFICFSYEIVLKVMGVICKNVFSWMNYEWMNYLGCCFTTSAILNWWYLRHVWQVVDFAVLGWTHFHQFKSKS